MIKYGSNNIGTMFFGNNRIGKAYLGSNLVYDTGSGPTPPGPTPTVETLAWDNGQLFNNKRYYKFLTTTVQEGDVITVKLNDYTGFKFGVVVCASKSYSAAATSDTGWLTQDLVKTISASESGKYLKFTVARINDATISASVGEAAIDTLKAERTV